MSNHIIFSDPGHGWCSVKRAELIELGIEATISHYSYQRGGTVYLEEDCDCAKFFNAYRAAHGVDPAFSHSHTDKRSPVRSYETFQPTRVNRELRAAT